ncbi:MAG TPA: outer membrane beta-barrel protein [Mucilaginibacter sp.]|nr:outer membrane beta-barrel protein [Mucilaginibacter sp.]
MKKLLLLVVLTSFAVLAKAQNNYKAFKVDLTFGYAIPSASSGSDGVKGGVTFTIEPHYRLSDAIAVGFRAEGAGLGFKDGTNEDTDVHVSILTSYCPTLEYYLSNGGFRPLIGGGAGIFAQSSLDVNSDSGEETALVPGASKFGFFPRIGFETGHFRMTGEYNILGNDSNYLAFKIGFFFGGGKN